MRGDICLARVIFLMLATVSTVFGTGCQPSAQPVAETQLVDAAERLQPEPISLMQLYVNDRSDPYENAIVRVDGIDFEFDHRCAMFGCFEFSCVFPSHVKNEVLAKAIQVAWDERRIEGLPEVDMGKIAIQCLEKTTATNVPEKMEVECELFDASINAFRAIDGSRNEIWLRLQRKPDDVKGP